MVVISGRRRPVRLAFFFGRGGMGDRLHQAVSAAERNESRSCGASSCLERRVAP